MATPSTASDSALSPATQRARKLIENVSRASRAAVDRGTLRARNGSRSKAVSVTTNDGGQLSPGRAGYDPRTGRQTSGPAKVITRDAEIASLLPRRSRPAAIVHAPVAAVAAVSVASVMQKSSPRKAAVPTVRRPKPKQTRAGAKSAESTENLMAALCGMFEAKTFGESGKTAKVVLVASSGTALLRLALVAP